MDLQIINLKMKTVTLIFMMFLMTSHHLFGQITNDPLKLKEVAPMVPEATSILKYGDIPVSTYTGVPDISIPLYTVNSGQLSIPISLSYHASGITVNQEATWVGLGWDIIAGGSITYVPVGGDDRINSISVTWADRSKLLYSMGVTAPVWTEEDHYMGWGCLTPPDIEESNYKILFNPLYLGLSDKAELDVYAVNIPGYSFKFIIHPQTNLPVFVGNKNKCKILYDSGNRNFTIIGEDGTKYFFTNKEWNMTNDAIDRWFLTSMVSPEGNWINFKYKSYGTLIMLPSFNDTYFFNIPPGGKRRSVGVQISKNTYYLEEIETPNELVKFCPDNIKRIDIGGTGAIKLSKITVQNKINNAFVKDYNFNYDYFTGCTIGGDFTTDDDWSMTIANDQLSKRLKLLQLSSNDNSGNSIEKHSFEYNEALPMPYKTSFARDFWGFYNGQENLSSLMPLHAKHTLLPNLSQLDLDRYASVTFYNGTIGIFPAGYLDSGGANRSASEAYASSWLLKSITYPTGGKTVFEFESNKFVNYKHYSADNFKSASLSIWDYNNVASNLVQSFTLIENTTVNIVSRFQSCNGATYNSMISAVVQVIGPIGPNATARNIQLSGADATEFNNNGYKVFNSSFNLNPGQYIFSCSGPDAIGSTSYIAIVGSSLSYNYVLRDNNFIGVGTRVKKIISKESDGSIKTVRNYKYISETGLSSGKLFAPVKCFQRKLLKYGNGSNTIFDYGFTLSSDNFMYPSSAYVGGDMGYSRVEVETLSAADNQTNNGKEITYFKNDVAVLYDNVPLFDVNTNGNTLRKIWLNRNSDTLRVENYQYEHGDENMEQLNYKIEDTWLGPISECGLGGFNNWAYIGRYKIFIYPNRNFHSFLQSKETFDYFNGAKVRTLTNYSYNLNNYAANQITELLSNNKTKTTNIKFPHDYNFIDPYQQMINYNMIYPEIERSEYIDGVFTQSVKTNYRQWSNNSNNFLFPYNNYVIKSETVSTKTGTNTDIIRLRYLNYDLEGNILSAAKENDVVTSYLWAFNNSYPVVKATNIDDIVLRNAVISVAGTTDLETFFNGFNNIATDATQQTTWKNFNTALRSNASLANAQITTYTFTPLVGMTSQTDPNGITTYFEYDSFGRLKNVKDKDQNILKSNQYHYYNN